VKEGWYNYEAIRIGITRQLAILATKRHIQMKIAVARIWLNVSVYSRVLLNAREKQKRKR
jgi:hypothetical protein